MYAQHSLMIDFEGETTSYSDWTFTQILSKKTNSNVSAHGGSYFGITNASTGSVVTKEKIASPQSITFFISKQSTNTSASWWRVQVSTDGSSWTNVGEDQSASVGIDRGTWYEVTRNLSTYSDVYVRIYYDGTSAVRCIDDVTLTYSTGGDATTCAVPTFSPAAGTFNEAQNVTISTTTDGATIYYTTDGTTPTTSSEVYSSPINVANTTTIKAMAAKENYSNSDVSSATYVIEPPVSGYTVDFESNLDKYTDWEFTNAERVETGTIEAHGGDYFATTGGKSTASFQTKESIAYPEIFTCYVSKTSTNTSASNWKVQVSEDGETWTDIVESSATDMTKGIWKSITANLSSYSNVYVRISYSGSTAVRAIDDISITMRDPSGKVTPTVVIDATALTNDLAGETNVSAGTATATVMDGQNAVENVSVTWTSSDTGVATIDATTGAVTLIAAGTTTLTATFAGNDDYNEASGTYQLTVIDSNAPGMENNPFTVAQAIAAITSGSFDANTNYYISGIISQIDEVNTTEYYNATYFISDDGETTTQLEVFRGKFLDNTNFTSLDQIQVGDEVVIYGKLQYYNNETPEIAQGNYIASLHRKAVRYYLVGSFDEDPWIDHKIEMTKGEGNTYSVEKMFGENTLFKIVKIDEIAGTDPVWYGGATNDETYGIHSGWYENIQLNAGDQYKNFKIEPAGTYTFTVDADNMELSVTGWPVPVYYLKGDFNDWGTNDQFVHQGNGIYTISKRVGANEKFKIVDENNNWYSNNYFSQDNCTDLGLYTNNNDMTTGVAGKFLFTLNTAVNPMSLTVTGGWPISEEGNMFVKVTSNENLEDAAYLIVYEDGKVAFNGGLATLDAASNNISVTISNNMIVADETTLAALFKVNKTNGTIQSASGHYIGINTYGNGLKQSDNDEDYTNDISIDASGNAVIVCSTSGGDMTLRFNKASNDNRFRYYKSGQQPIQLYKLVTLPMNDIVITSAEWATYVPNLAVTIPEDVTAYIVTNATSTSVTLSSVASAPANTGLVVNGAQGTYTPTAAETTDDVSGNLLVVSDGTVKGDGATIYALGNKGGTVGFKRVANDVTVPAGKPYLTIESSGSKDFFDFSFNEGVATGIESVESIGFDMNAPVYDLQGRQVNRLHKGVFIQNGKKIIVK